MPHEVKELLEDAWSKVSDLNPTRYARLGGSPALQRFVECAYVAMRAQQELLTALAAPQTLPPPPEQPPRPPSSSPKPRSQRAQASRRAKTTLETEKPEKSTREERLDALSESV